RDQRWGQDALSTATDLITHNTTATTNDIGAPAEYDTAIDTSYGLRVKKCVRNRGFSRIDL
ncbi:hypothetical protein ACN4D0_10725, partial [Corynebacterium macclintockiae]